MNRLQKKIAEKVAAAEKMLSVFIAAGFPELNSTPDYVLAFEKAGADFIEIGLPFSDPIADGPVIQHASQIALNNGVTLEKCFHQIHLIRKSSQIPILLMGYFNPIFKFGVKSFLQQAESSGVDGLIIPDLLPEEFARFQNEFATSTIGVNFLISPNTGMERIKHIDTLTQSFIYCTSVTGTTGVRENVSADLHRYLVRVRESVKHPYFVGFGIANEREAERISRECDGIIVGSAVIKKIDEAPTGQKLETASSFVSQLKEAIVNGDS